jgi:hypothetical protein
MMDSTQITKALSDIRPKAEWALTGDSFEGLEWLDKKQTKPTLAEIEAAIANPLPEVELTVDQKLASVGLSIDDLKAALGV